MSILKLLSFGRFEDAMVLKLTCSLACLPTNLELITYESIYENGVWKMWDTHSHSFKKFLLWNEIISDLEFYKQHSKIRGTQSTINCKMSIDGKIIRGTFVFNLSKANIFIRYKRKFGGKLPLFNWAQRKLQI